MSDTTFDRASGVPAPPDTGFDDLVKRFDKLMRDASNARKRGFEDSEESFRNKANEIAQQIVARFRKHQRAAAPGAAAVSREEPACDLPSRLLGHALAIERTVTSAHDTSLVALLREAAEAVDAKWDEPSAVVSPLADIQQRAVKILREFMRQDRVMRATYATDVGLATAADHALALLCEVDAS